MTTQHKLDGAFDLQPSSSDPFILYHSSPPCIRVLRCAKLGIEIDKTQIVFSGLSNVRSFGELMLMIVCMDWVRFRLIGGWWSMGDDDGDYYIRSDRQVVELYGTVDVPNYF